MAQAQAQTQAQAAKPAVPAPANAAKARPAAKPPAKAPAVSAVPAGPAGKGWRSAPTPAWVVAAPAPPTDLPAPPPATGRRELAFEQQSNYTLPKPQTYLRLKAVALDPSALGSVSQPQIQFNPAFQTVLLHSVAVWRDGQRLERAAQARIELMRREQRLEQQVVDGTETLLVVLSDVRVGEPVELAYTLEGENPIFEGRIATGVSAGFDQPLDLLHWRLLAPANKTLQTRALAGAPEPQRSTNAAGQQVISLVRHHVPAVPAEQGTPPWFKVNPAAYVSEYSSWAEVDTWAQRLFALPAGPAHPAVAARAQAFKDSGKQGAELVSEVLRFVQDEVRYFSVSLGESSHRPKPPETTLAELLGDCKDKTVLLNALLRELGFDARPALVSVNRNRGLAQFLPGHDQFDHVITALTLDGRRWLLDGTLTGQGLVLASRGQWDYGSALIIGGDGTLVDARESADAVNHLAFEQTWDLARAGQAATLLTRMRAHGQAAERWRAGASAGGAERVGQALTASFARMHPGLEALGPAELQDDRVANVFTVAMKFRLADAGRYGNGVLEFEVGAIELLDALGGPPELRRKSPWFLDLPRAVESQLSVTAPANFRGTPPPLLEIADRHLRYSARVHMTGPTVRFDRKVERRSDEVLPADLEGYRENVMRARGALSNTLRLPLIDSTGLQDEVGRIERRLRSSRGWRDDQLGNILARNEFSRFFDGQVLTRVEPRSMLAAQVLSARAAANNLLGDFAAGLKDAEAALAVQPQREEALDAKAVALVGGARPGSTAQALEDALATFTELANQHQRKPQVLSWMGSIHVMQGRGEPAGALLREALDKASGPEREFILIWSYLAGELNGGQGREAVAAHVESVDADKLTGAILRYLTGSLSREALLARAEKQPTMARLDLAEAHFFIGMQAAVRGQRDEALRSFKRTVDIGAVPYREHTFARMELQRTR
jgi:tetratricopeptide (TPR) repeat protein